jgi:lipoic acid synthetase
VKLKDTRSIFNRLEVIDWKVLRYSEALTRQKTLVLDRIAEKSFDRLVLVEHPSVITIGRSGNKNDLCRPEGLLRQKGIGTFYVDRGGRATFHGPGQLIAYPIIKLEEKDLHAYLQKLLNAAVALLRDYGLKPELKSNQPGIWIDGAKIASVGIAVEKWVTSHGLALNVNTELSGYKFIVPCGQAGQAVTSMREVLGRSLRLTDVKNRFIAQFANTFGYTGVTTKAYGETDQVTIKHPDWLIKPAADTRAVNEMQHLLRKWNLSTVCQSAHCPNLSECFSQKTATFMILGNVCTRNCRFCAVDAGSPQLVDSGEPMRVARIVKQLGLQYVVITSVTRDDLPDGGAQHFEKTIRAIRSLCPQTKVEVLVSDFNGSTGALGTVCDARPDMFNHNIETVSGLYSVVRPQASYRRSLDVLKYAADSGLPVKSGIMLGLGETSDQIEKTLRDIWQTGCRYLTIGQYLAPSAKHLPMARYVTPGEFDDYAQIARDIGFKNVASEPLVRSSYRAAAMSHAKDSESYKDINAQPFETQTRRLKHAYFK